MSGARDGTKQDSPARAAAEVEVLVGHAGDWQRAGTGLVDSAVGVGLEAPQSSTVEQRHLERPLRLTDIGTNIGVSFFIIPSGKDRSGV
jgi:hypothetical protein